MQILLDESRKTAGKHLLEVLKPVPARKVCRKLVGVKQVAWATVNSKGEPRVAPVDAVFLHSRFYLSTDFTSLRVRHLLSNPATSVTYFERDSFAIIVHGTGKIIREGNSLFSGAKREFMKHYGKELIASLRELLFVQVAPKLMFTHAYS